MGGLIISQHFLINLTRISQQLTGKEMWPQFLVRGPIVDQASPHLMGLGASAMSRPLAERTVHLLVEQNAC